MTRKQTKPAKAMRRAHQLAARKDCYQELKDIWQVDSAWAACVKQAWSEIKGGPVFVAAETEEWMLLEEDGTLTPTVNVHAETINVIINAPAPAIAEPDEAEAVYSVAESYKRFLGGDGLGGLMKRIAAAVA